MQAQDDGALEALSKAALRALDGEMTGADDWQPFDNLVYPDALIWMSPLQTALDPGWLLVVRGCELFVSLAAFSRCSSSRFLFVHRPFVF